MESLKTEVVYRHIDTSTLNAHLHTLVNTNTIITVNNNDNANTYVFKNILFAIINLNNVIYVYNCKKYVLQNLSGCIGIVIYRDYFIYVVQVPIVAIR